MGPGMWFASSILDDLRECCYLISTEWHRKSTYWTAVITEEDPLLTTEVSDPLDQSIMSLHPISAAAHNIQEETTTGVSSCSSLQCCALLIILRECVNNRSSPVLLCTSYVNIYFWIVGFLEELLFSQSFEDHSLYVQWIYYWADLDGDKCSKALCTRLERIRKPSFPVSWVWRKYLPLQLF